MELSELEGNTLCSCRGLEMHRVATARGCFFLPRPESSRPASIPSMICSDLPHNCSLLPKQSPICIHSVRHAPSASYHEENEVSYLPFYLRERLFKLGLAPPHPSSTIIHPSTYSRFPSPPRDPLIASQGAMSPACPKPRSKTWVLKLLSRLLHNPSMIPDSAASSRSRRYISLVIPVGCDPTSARASPLTFS